ncbi:hypothetical protein QBC44DRAFT_390935 [Cladorrhinum sp. PSN332]|nr:hypothetical protein QBC44DRAFT_390935 [Cladorrhinum sp. PSN332]
MAAHEYSGGKPLPDPNRNEYSSTAYYGGDSQSASSFSAPAPAYTSQHLGSSNRSGQGPSPFETVFDDHVYPARSPSTSQNQLSQQDTAYRPSSRASSEEMAYNHPADDIPLRDQSQRYPPGKDAAIEMQDHVYDAPQQPEGSKRRTGKLVRFGELGMLGGKGKNKIPFVVYFFTLVQVAVFIGEIIKNATATGSPIMIKPSFNPMIGPSPFILINMGARFVPCMHNIASIQGRTTPINWPCPWTTTNDPGPDNNCTLSDLCGFGGVPEPKYAIGASFDDKPEPNQWFRFIIPIFLHAGLVHIGFNLLMQLTMGKDMERSIGSIRFFLVYMSSGIFGFVLGGNFAATGIASTGASGSLFGVIALNLLDLLYSWKDRMSPVKDLVFILMDIAISFVLGLLPGLDNFSHIGGFLMGLALGICVLHSPNALRRRIGDDTPYASSQVGNGFLTQGTPPSFMKNPVGFFKGRKPLWWAWWLIRVAALILVFVIFILLLNNFYIYRNECDWCKYLSCLVSSDQCD